MSKLNHLGLLLILAVSITVNASLSIDSYNEIQEFPLHSDAEKLSKCYDDIVNLKIEQLERTTQVFEGLINRFLKEEPKNIDKTINATNLTSSFELMRQMVMNMDLELKELKGTLKFQNILNEKFKNDILIILNDALYNHSAKLSENMTNLYAKQKSEIELLVNEKLTSNEVMPLTVTRDYDKNLNCLLKCNHTETIPKSCAEATKTKKFKDDIYALNIPNSNLRPFYVFCTHENPDETAWTIIQRREDGSQNFNRNWTDYQNGFGDAYGEYWIGLERLHMLTKNQTHKLWVSLVDYDGVKRYAKYSKFSIASEDEDYKLTIDGYSGDAGDAFIYHNNKKFATYDNDSEEGCAEFFESGWWYNNCYYCNLNGVFRSYANQKMYNGIKWNGWHRRSLRYVHMAIQPVFR